MACSPSNDDSGDTRARLSRDERRAHILAAAATEFARGGYFGASTASIARIAGCSEAMLYKHFSSKQALFSATLRNALTDTRSRFEEMSESACGDIVDVAKSYYRAILNDPEYTELLRLRMMAITKVDDPDVRAAVQEFDDAVLRRVRDFLHPAQRDGTVRPDVSAEFVATLWFGIMLAACHRQAISNDGFTHASPHLMQFLDGLRAQ